jgi:hypothetical protein
MALFKPNKVDASKRRIELLANSDDTQQLAFGLQWTSIVSGGGKDAAAKLAKQRGASHFIFRNQQVGYGYIDTKKNPIKAGVPVYPAALVAAIQYGGDALIFIKIGPGEYWLAEIRNSLPTSLDRFIFADNDSVVLEEAEQIVSAAGGDLTYKIFTNLSAHGFESVSRTSAEDLLLASSGAPKMEALPKATSVNFPKPVLIAIAVGGVLLVANYVWNWKQELDAKKRAQQESQSVDISPEQAWRQALATWQTTRAAPGASGYQIARNSLGKVPVMWDGWYLEDATCKAGPVVAGEKPSRTWSCAAAYQRSRAGSLNNVMVNQIPPDWTVKFVPLNKMVASWSIQEPVAYINVAEFQTVDFHLTQTLSKFQALGSAFTASPEISFVPIDIPPPKKLSDGTAYAPDPTMANLSASKVLFKGPLRTADRLVQSDLLIDYTSVSLTAKPSIGLSDSISEQLTKSAVDAEVTGVLYATKAR